MAEEMNPSEMGERPPMQNGNSMRDLPPAAQQRLMQPSEEIGAVLLARISIMTPEELKTLDRAITPDTARVLAKLLPELEQIIQQIGNASSPAQQPAQGQMGALGGMR